MSVEIPKVQLLKPKEASKKLGVSLSTLRYLARNGKIEARKTPGGHYLYVYREANEEKQKNRRKIVYARVSSAKQSEDLKRQIKYLKKKYPGYEVVSDIGSGINYKRKGFREILEQLLSGDIEEVVVAYKDRFSRFGFEFFEWLFKKQKARLKTMEESTSNGQKEFVSDIMEVLTVFTARYYGKRKYQRKNVS